jgi:DNA-binding NarL/FixJ family response regulator
VQKFKPHLLILDINLPDGSGIDAVAQLKQRCGSSRVLLCTAYVSDEAVVDALRSGADGFVEKTNSWADFMEAVERVSRGERYFYTQTATNGVAGTRDARRHREMDKLASLSAREREILNRVARGESSKQIALALGISVGTTDVHRVNLMKKIGVRNIAGLVTFAFHVGLIS